ncbi:sensor histidine kinase KdpD [Hyphomicrobium sp. CS1GBMeth3]|uniref:sensor histidine kinase n=1 Tax=Hyphomicrobium sp. CS1GBMeth3 TaxID=1892845 RepID=UPI0009311105|nr:sensor histidine kinase KdpD [Hyphomicrobium sp. CS1GBMeth3]
MAESTNTNEARRPSPRALLELAAKEQRGKLKVFLGMAPGVGKTYAMLSAARALKAEGLDVVIGLVETHGRPETTALIEGLEVLPRRAISYRNRTLLEFDVDAAIARRPQLLLVDEFAHSNAPGLVHPKRYQDVDGVLQAGIDVWTTLNIQHLESLTDVVQRIAGITVRETVPDKVVERADEIVVVDLPPEELIKRLKEGKVYLPDNARRAIDKFFQLSNLTALRELALRRTADRVDEQMLSQLRQQGIEGPWPTAERLLVCVGSDELSETVVRAAARMAAALKSDWIAIHLAHSDRESTDRKDVRRIEKAMRLAGRLGATAVRINARDLAAEVLAYAKRNNITQIVIGRSRPGFLGGWMRRSLSTELMAKAAGISVTVVAPETSPSRTLRFALPKIDTLWTGGLTAAAAVALSVAVGTLLERITDLPNLSMVFLLAVLICALRFGLHSAIAAAVFSFLAFNFFFIEPRYTLTVASPHELFALLIFLAVAIATGSLAGRLREQASATRERAEATQALYEFSRKLSGAPKIDDVLWLLAAQSAAIVKGKSIILLEKSGELSIEGGWPPEDTLGTADWAAARWAHRKGEPAGRMTETMPSAVFHFRPLISSPNVIGVLGVAPDETTDTLPLATASAVQAFADQAAIAIERTRLVEQATEAATTVESERLRNALLSSISHDLRTPLASILGSATSLRQLGDRMGKKDRADLLATIEEEANRLSVFVSNLLHMTRLEAGALDICRDWVDVRDAVNGAVSRAARALPKRRVQMSLEDGLPLIRGDAALLEQVLFNLLDNAHKYSPPVSVTRIDARATAGGVRIAVSDEGIGIPAESLSKVFEKFYRVAGSDGRAPGTGLGLSISAAIVKAMGGTIEARSPAASGKGTEISILLPAGEGQSDNQGDKGTT